VGHNRVLNEENVEKHTGRDVKGMVTDLLKDFSFLWQFDPIPGHGLPLRGFAFTLRHITFGKTPLDK